MKKFEENQKVTDKRYQKSLISLRLKTVRTWRLNQRKKMIHFEN